MSRELGAGVFGGAISGVASHSLATTVVSGAVTSAATEAALSCGVAAVTPEIAATMGVVASVNVTAGVTAPATAAAVTAAGTNAGLSTTSAAVVSKSTCVAAASKFAFLSWIPPVAAVVGGIAGAYCTYSLFRSIKAAREETREEMRDLRRLVEAQGGMFARQHELFVQRFLHNLDDMRLESLRDLFTCPITLEIITEPVYMEDERFYERAAITQWYERTLAAGLPLRSPVNCHTLLSDPRNIATHLQASNFIRDNRDKLIVQDEVVGLRV